MCDNFECSRCHNVDSIHATQQTTAGEWLCSRCKDGEWHNQFPEEKADENSDEPLLNRPGYGTSFS